MFRIKLTDIIMAFSNSIDLICSSMTYHHKRVAYIAYNISTEMGLNEKDKADVLIAALLHDCGAIQDDEKLKAGQYDFGTTIAERHAHGFKGWKLVQGMEELQTAAEIIRYHHIYWDEPVSQFTINRKIPLGSYIVHLSDRIDTLLDRVEDVLDQRRRIEGIVKEDSGKMFMPEAVEAFMKISGGDFFWFDLVTPFLNQEINEFLNSINTTINIDKLHFVAGIMNKIIDYRSSFTATHSIGVAECASALSAKMEFTDYDIKMMHIAGLLHDLGKLAIPVEILEKNGPLSKNEFNIMKKHTYLSYRILEAIPQIETINQWASFHHERLDGTGYPFKIGDEGLSLGSRIMAVSDVFTALTEERPYRSAMSVEKAVDIMEEMVNKDHLDPDVFASLKLHIDEINQLKVNAQRNATSVFWDLKLLTTSVSTSGRMAIESRAK